MTKPITSKSKTHTDHPPPLATPEPPQKKPRTGENDTLEFPEGGRGWLVIAGTFVIMGTSFGLVSAYGVYQAHYLKQFPSTSQSVLTMIGSLQPFMIYMSGAPAVALIRKWGAKAVVALSGVILVLSLMLIPLCNSVWQLFFAQGVLFGFGSGLGVFVSYSVPQQWFKRKRAMAVGLAASGSSVGGLLWPVVFELLNDGLGFSWACRIMGFIAIPLMVFASFAIKEREIHPAPTTLDDEEEDVLPVISNKDLEKPTEVTVEDLGCQESSTITTTTTNTAAPSKPSKWKLSKLNPFPFLDWSVIKDFHFAFILATNFVAFFGLFAPLFFLPSYAARVPGISPKVAKYIVTICNSASVLGRILPGVIGDRIGRLNTLIPSIMLCGLCQLAFWLPAKNDALIIIFALSFGYTSGAVVSLFPACLGQLFGIHSLQSRLCIMFLFAAPSAFAGPAICGLFLPLPSEPGIQGYSNLIIFCSVAHITAALLLVYCRLSISRKFLIFL